MYSYLANSPLVSSIVFKQGSTTRMTTTKSYDLLNRLTTISSAPSVSATVGFTYAYNSAGQRYQVNVVADGETSQWQYDYDTLGQVTSGKHLLGEVRLAGEHFEYAFDTIGNRKSTKSGGEASFFYPATLRSSAYTVNALNQYTTRTVPGYVNVIGVASNGAAKVWVNKQAPERHPIFPTHFRKELPVANTAGPVWLGVTNLAVLNQGSNPDIIATNKGNVLVPMTPESFTYDLDGNQTSDSLWTNVWNGENRRVVIESSISSGTGVPTVARAREVWTHLPDGRWIERIVSTNNGSAYVPVFTNRYVWDGNVLLAVLNNVNGLELSFMRGIDLSGAPLLGGAGGGLQGAGGVGGLLAVFSPSAINSQPSTHFASTDGNGNVTMLVNAADGKESARYETGPFAEPLRMTGPMAKINPIRYSTQYADDVTGDIKYLFRDYTAGTGRWLNRDPIAERGGKNLFGFAKNCPLSKFDLLGLSVRERHVIDRHEVWDINGTDDEDDFPLLIVPTLGLWVFLDPKDDHLATYTIEFDYGCTDDGVAYVNNEKLTIQKFMKTFYATGDIKSGAGADIGRKNAWVEANWWGDYSNIEPGNLAWAALDVAGTVAGGEVGWIAVISNGGSILGGLASANQSTAVYMKHLWKINCNCACPEVSRQEGAHIELTTYSTKSGDLVFRAGDYRRTYNSTP